MSWLPAWDSASTTQKIEQWCEFIGVILLVLTTTVVILSYAYGYRHEKLASIEDEKEKSEMRARYDAEIAGLQQKLAPRSLTPEQKTMLERLLSAGPKGDVAVVPKGFDEEAGAYAGQIKQVLEKAGFSIKPTLGQMPMTFHVSGAFIAVKDMNAPPAHAAFVQECFQKVGITLDGFSLPDAYNIGKFDDSTVIICVAVKP